MDGEKLITGHISNNVRKHSGGIDDQLGIDCSPVGDNAGNAIMLLLHSQHYGVKSNFRTILHGVFRIGHGHFVG